MKKNHFIIVFFFLIVSQVAISQNDTIKGLLLDVNNKVIKNYPVKLGNASSVTVKTDNNGIFIFPNANLNDTLFVADKKGQNAIAIPINGSRFITLKSIEGDFNTTYLSEPDEQFLHYLKQMESDRKRNLNTLTREDIVNSGCRDVLCLLRRLSGVTIYRDQITIRGMASSLQSSSAPLIVLDGVALGTDFSFNNISIDEIQDITVLKDASIYGVRGSNGAIVINTRK